MFSAFGLCRGGIYISICASASLVACYFGFTKSEGGLDAYFQYLGTAVGLSFTAYSIIINLGGSDRNRLAQNANDGKSPLEVLFAVFTCSICIHLLTLAVIFIFDSTGNIAFWYVAVGLLSVCIISLCDVGLNFFTLYTFLKGQ